MNKNWPFQTRSVDLTSVQGSVKATISTLEHLRGGNGENFKGLEQYIEAMTGGTVEYARSEQDTFVRNVSINIAVSFYI